MVLPLYMATGPAIHRRQGPAGPLPGQTAAIASVGSCPSPSASLPCALGGFALGRVLGPNPVRDPFVGSGPEPSEASFWGRVLTRAGSARARAFVESVSADLLAIGATRRIRWPSPTSWPSSKPSADLRSGIQMADPYASSLAPAEDRFLQTSCHRGQNTQIPIHTLAWFHARPPPAPRAGLRGDLVRERGRGQGASRPARTGRPIHCVSAECPGPSRRGAACPPRLRRPCPPLVDFRRGNSFRIMSTRISTRGGARV